MPSEDRSWLVKGAQVVIIDNHNYAERVTTDVIKNIGVKFITLEQCPDRFKISSLTHSSPNSRGWCTLVAPQSDKARRALAKQRRRNLESWAASKCYEFYRARNRTSLENALTALKEYQELLNEVNE